MAGVVTLVRQVRSIGPMQATIDEEVALELGVCCSITVNPARPGIGTSLHELTDQEVDEWRQKAKKKQAQVRVVSLDECKSHFTKFIREMLQRGASPSPTALLRIYSKDEIREYLPELAHMFPVTQEEVVSGATPELLADIQQGLRANNPVAAIRYFVQAANKGKALLPTIDPPVKLEIMSWVSLAEGLYSFCEGCDVGGKSCFDEAAEKFEEAATVIPGAFYPSRLICKALAAEDPATKSRMLDRANSSSAELRNTFEVQLVSFLSRSARGAVTEKEGGSGPGIELKIEADMARVKGMMRTYTIPLKIGGDEAKVFTEARIKKTGVLRRPEERILRGQAIYAPNLIVDTKHRTHEYDLIRGEKSYDNRSQDMIRETIRRYNATEGRTEGRFIELPVSVEEFVLGHDINPNDVLEVVLFYFPYWSVEKYDEKQDIRTYLVFAAWVSTDYLNAKERPRGRYIFSFFTKETLPWFKYFKSLMDRK